MGRPARQMRAPVEALSVRIGGSAMVKMINGLFGNEMYVSDDRVNEYLAAGHKLAAEKPVVKEKKRSPKKSKKK